MVFGEFHMIKQLYKTKVSEIFKSSDQLTITESIVSNAKLF